MKNVIYMRQLFVVVLFVILSTSLVQADGYRPITEERRFGICLNAIGPTIITSISANYYLSSKIKAEAGVGLFGYFLGSTYHFGGSKIGKASPYIGTYFSRTPLPLNQNYMDPYLYCPIGVGGHGKNGISFHVEVAYFKNLSSSIDHILGAIKLGYYFDSHNPL